MIWKNIKVLFETKIFLVRIVEEKIQIKIPDMFCKKSGCENESYVKKRINKEVMIVTESFWWVVLIVLFDEVWNDGMCVCVLYMMYYVWDKCENGGIVMALASDARKRG